MRRFLLSLLLGAGLSQAATQYDDYPVAEFEYPHHRLIWSPLRLIGGPDASMMDQNVKVELNFIPGINSQTLRYEYVIGPSGSIAVGPSVNFQFSTDSLEYQSFAGGAYLRIYQGLGQGFYAHLGANYMMTSGIKFESGDTKVDLAGPEFSPNLGYMWRIKEKWVLNMQLGCTVGYYSTEYDNAAGEVISRNNGQHYKNGSDVGGYFHSQLEIGYAF